MALASLLNRLRPLALCLALALARPVAAEPMPGSTRTELLNYTTPLATLLGARRPKPAELSLKVEKRLYRLSVLADRKPIKSYPVVLGLDPVNDKLKSGDCRTPEGVFHVRDSYKHPDWSHFIWFDYPTRDSWRKHQAAKAKGLIGPTDTIGGEVGIHGVPTGEDGLIDQRQNWTLGCISLKTGDIREIAAIVKRGMRVEIVN